jgi:hypothetical protein
MLSNRQADSDLLKKEVSCANACFLAAFLPPMMRAPQVLNMMLFLTPPHHHPKNATSPVLALQPPHLLAQVSA